MTKRIATSADLDDLLNEELSWRRMEIQALISEARRVSRKPGTPASDALLRATQTMLYAHWEGFFKAAFDAYVDHLSNRRISVDSACDELVETQLVQAVMRRKSGDGVMLSDFVQALRGGPMPRVHKLRQARLVNTRSNLRFEVAYEISEAVGVKLPQLVTKQKVINASLCDARNHIAHGKHLRLDLSDVEFLRDQVIAMMEHVRDQLSLYGATKLYLRPDRNASFSVDD